MTPVNSLESKINLLSRKEKLLSRGLPVLLLVTYGQCFGLGIYLFPF
nr:MAG TPA: hypothetical protein [Caudoviricetes sp.]